MKSEERKGARTNERVKIMLEYRTETDKNEDSEW